MCNALRNGTLFGKKINLCSRFTCTHDHKNLQVNTGPGGGWWSQMYGGGVHTLWGEKITQRRRGRGKKIMRPVMLSSARIPNIIMLHSSPPAGDDDDATSVPVMPRRRPSTPACRVASSRHYSMCIIVIITIIIHRTVMMMIILIIRTKRVP